jgi:thiol-disulfide isomerase/thioredoxin
MDIHHVGDHECINCGECIGVCPTKAISYKGARIILPENELDAAKTDEERATIEEKRTKRVKLASRVTALVLSVVLVFSLVYVNFIHDDGTSEPPVVDTPNEDDIDIPMGSAVGQMCPTYSLDLVDGSGKVNIKDYRGKIVIVNFWGVWCTPCKKELPDFNEVATEYKDDVVVLTIHTNLNRNKAPAYIEENFANSDMLFAYDLPLSEYVDMYYNLLGGNGPYPRTLILDRRGVITFTRNGEVDHAKLVEEIEKIQQQ